MAHRIANTHTPIYSTVTGTWILGVLTTGLSSSVTITMRPLTLGSIFFHVLLTNYAQRQYSICKKLNPKSLE